MFTNIGRDHATHAKFVRRLVAGKTTDVKRGDYSVQCGYPLAIPTRRDSVGNSLGQKSRDQASQCISRAGRAEAGVAGRINKHATIRRSNQRTTTLQEQNHFVRRCELARCRDSIIER